MNTKDKKIKGGRIKKPKSLKQIGREIDKGWKEKVARPANKQFFKPAEKALQNAGAEIGKFTNEKILPTVVSTGIPLASMALGALGTEFGIPPEITSQLSENLMKEFIPKQYQTDNKYVGMLGDALNMGISGKVDPNKAMELGGKFIGSLSSDITGKNKISQQTPSSDYYEPENPYDDIIRQLISNYQTVPDKSSNETLQSIQQPVQETVPQSVQQENDTTYSDGQIGDGSDSLTITKSPYEQKEGSPVGLLGAGIKKKRGRPKKHIIEVITKTQIPRKKFTHSKNKALDQLLEANMENEDKKHKNLINSMIEMQSRKLTRQGYNNANPNPNFDDGNRNIGNRLGNGLKPQKGSIEMKEKMAKLRAMKKK